MKKSKLERVSTFFPCGLKKRGQLTLFVIVAVVLVVGIAGYFIVKDVILDKPIPGSEIIRDSVDDCLTFTTKNALYFVSYQGGYNTRPERNFNFDPSYFSYYYYEGQDMMPSLEMMESEMGVYVAENLGGCFDSLEVAGFEIDYNQFDVDVDISKDGVEFVVKSPIGLSREEASMVIELKRFSVFHETKLYDMYEISKFFVTDQVEDPETYCISCIAEMAAEAGIYFYLFPVFEDIILVTAFEKNNEPLVLNFVNKYVPNDE
jgi:hypothetical protein